MEDVDACEEADVERSCIMMRSACWALPPFVVSVFVLSRVSPRALLIVLVGS